VSDDPLQVPAQVALAAMHPGCPGLGAPVIRAQVPDELQATHAPSQATLQQTPSAQTPETQVAPLVHGVPSPASVSGCWTGASGIVAASIWIPPVEVPLESGIPLSVGEMFWPPVATTPPMVLPATPMSPVGIPPKAEASADGGVPPVEMIPPVALGPSETRTPSVLVEPSALVPPVEGGVSPEVARSSLAVASMLEKVVDGSL